MTATPSIDLPGWMAEQLGQASPDLLRQMVQPFAEALMSADATLSAAPATASAALTAATPAAASGIEVGTPAPAASTSPSRGCGKGPTSLTGC